MASTKVKADSLKAWYKSMFFYTFQSRIALANMLFDCKNNRIDKPVFGLFRHYMSEEWNAIKKRGEAPHVLIPKVVDAHRGELLMRGTKVTAVRGGLSRIIDTAALFQFNVDPNRVVVPLGKPTTSRKIRRLQQEGLEETLHTKLSSEDPDFENMLSSRRGFVWVTRTPAIKAVRKRYASRPRTELANRLRDRAGLVHYYETPHLVEIRYPAHIVDQLLATGELINPCFLEGSPTIVFRSTTADSNGWGRTVDLRSKDDHYIDGLPEAVHQAIPFSEMFQVFEIGEVSKSPQIDYSTFLDGLPYQPEEDSYSDLDTYG